MSDHRHRRAPPVPIRHAPPRPAPPPSYDAPRPPAPTARDDQWAVLLGGRQALARAGWGRRLRAWAGAPLEVQEELADWGGRGYATAAFKRVLRLDLVDPRWLDELDALGATLKQLRWLAGPGAGCLPERVARRAALVLHLRAAAAAGRPPTRGFDVVMAHERRVGVGARPPTEARRRGRQ